MTAKFAQYQCNILSIFMLDLEIYQLKMWEECINLTAPLLPRVQGDGLGWVAE